ncbi:MAG: hypothetical protein U9Q66_00310 [Patescibacteria group bacterium]|nr:hypothetical protein [Patescibacteria group bacterium]
MNSHSICNDCSLNILKYEFNIFDENFKESIGEIIQEVEIVSSKESRFTISPNLAFEISYLTLSTGEKFASINKTDTSSSSSLSISILLYQTFFSTLISISNSNQSLSISVMYISLFNTSTPSDVLISLAVITQAVDLEIFSHDIHESFLSKINHLRFNIISIIPSLIHGNVEYS